MELDFSVRLDPQAPRQERLERLKQYYLRYLVEDPQDGTTFDCAILDFLRDMEEEYKENLGQCSWGI